MLERSKKLNLEADYSKISAIKSIEKGRCTVSLRRKNAFGKNIAKEEKSFACITKDQGISLECSSEQERNQWVAALTELKLFLKSQKTPKVDPVQLRPRVMVWRCQLA